MNDADEIKLNAIKCSSWFQDVPGDVIESLAHNSEVKKYNSGETIFKYGDQRDFVYGVISGCVQLSMAAASNKNDEFSVIDLHENTWFGESAILINQSKVFTITAVEESTISVLNAEQLVKNADKCPVIYKNMYLAKLRFLQLIYNLLGDLIVTPPKARMAMELLNFLEAKGVTSEQSIEVNPALNLKEWAKICMVPMERLISIFDEWVDDGLIVHHKGGWLIPNIEPLKNEINQ